jgi:metallophosphoesterase superfamily enzyme
VLRGIAARAQLICVKGNHDRQFHRDFSGLGLALVDEWKADGLKAVHGDRLPKTTAPGELLIIGHLHPAVGLEDAAGVRQRVPAFLIAGPVVVLPAFSPFAAGLDVWRRLPEEIAALSGDAPPEVVAATGARAVALGPLARLTSPASGTRPRNYRASK